MARLRWLKAADHALALAARIVDDELDRVDPFGRTTGGSTAPTNKLGQVSAQIIGDGLMEAHPHEPALLLGQPQPIIDAETDMHAATNQSASAIRSP
jgi:hypothetical protein